MQTVIKLHDKDNVAVALTDLKAGQNISVGAENIQIAEDIPQGHKFALKELSTGDEVLKYGYSIGKTVEPVTRGGWIHTHNLKTGLGEMLKYSYEPLTGVEKVGTGEAAVIDPQVSMNHSGLTFEGFKRPDGKVGIRNEIWIIPTVGCVNDVARLLEKQGKEYLTGSVEDLVAYTHPYGCSQLGGDQENTQKILAGLIKHPNAAGVLVLGLGCENNNINEMKKYLGECPDERVKFLVCQDYEDEIEQGLHLIKELIDYASGFQREELPAGDLIVGLKCGGSDGLSGITANPTVGAFSDLLVADGGTTILTEVPEMFGAETILMNRCADEALFEKTVDLINDFKKYYSDHGQPIYENPSPGNKTGGISTLEDKSLGCTQKSGNAPVSGVFPYGEQVTGQGLMLLSAPGNDLVASTALAAAGAHIILFTTGRGTPFGAPVPTIKISSNSALAEKKKTWIDFDAGRMLKDRSLSELSEELYQLVIRVASGKKVRSEENGFRDLAIFKKGVTL